MTFSRRVTRCAVMAWALYLIIALSAFALHTHASDEVGAAHCAICLAHNVTAAATVVAAFVLLAPALVWRDQRWIALAQTPVIAAPARRCLSRAPPVEAPSRTPN